VVLQQPTNGSGAEELLTSGPANEYVTSWSADGRFILYHTGNAGSQTNNDIWVVPTFGDRKPKPFLVTSFFELDARFSPDGRWVAYRSNESGQFEVYVVPFPGPGGKWQVSNGGGLFPRWRRDGKELFYLSPGNKAVVAVPMDASGTSVDVGMPKRLFDAHMRTSNYHGYGSGDVYDVFPDGQRFLLNVAVNDPMPSPIRVITNWTSTLK
jgi:dipeptidyl aminopeptidase/acylaminoacyl peptidase